MSRMHHARRAFAGLAALTAVFTLTWAPARAESITVTHWGDAFYGAPYAVAMEKGYFKAHGVNIDGILTSTGGGTSVRNTLASGLPYGEVALSAAIEAINAGQDIKVVNSAVSTVADILWIAKPDSPLSGVKSLIGKKVGFTSPGSVTNMLILMAFRDAGIKPDQVQLVPVGGIGANLTAVLTGAVDTAMSGEPVWSKNKSKVKPVFWTKDVMSPHMTQTVGVVTTEFAKAHPDVIRGIIAARLEGLRYLMAHPDESADIVAKTVNMEPSLVRDVFKNFVEIKYWDEGKFDYAAMDRMVEGLQIVGKQKGQVDWSKVVDQSFLPKEQQSSR